MSIKLQMHPKALRLLACETESYVSRQMAHQRGPEASQLKAEILAAALGSALGELDVAEADPIVFEQITGRCEQARANVRGLFKAIEKLSQT